MNHVYRFWWFMCGRVIVLVSCYLSICGLRLGFLFSACLFWVLTDDYVAVFACWLRVCWGLIGFHKFLEWLSLFMHVEEWRHLIFKRECEILFGDNLHTSGDQKRLGCVVFCKVFRFQESWWWWWNHKDWISSVESFNIQSSCI